MRALQRPATVLWVAVFLYAALAAVLVQTVVLPRWVPGWHAGHGYLAVAILPWGLWRWRDHLELHVLAFYCLAMMLVYALAVPNVGALYRFRYPFETLLIGLAVATALVRREPAVSPPEREASGHGRGAGSGRPGSA